MDVTAIVNSRSLKPYIVFALLNAFIFISCLALSSMRLGYGLVSHLGGLYGSAFASVDFRLNPVFFLGCLLIYCVRKPIIAAILVVLFSIFYQIYLVEYLQITKILGVPRHGWIHFPSIYGGLLLVSVVGLLEAAWLRFVPRS